MQECLVGILQNNAVSIELTIEERKINTLIESFFTEALEMKSGQLTTKYLRLFSTFIKCDNRVLKENQKIILNNFFKNRSNFLSFKFRLQDKEVEESSQIVVQEAPIFKREETDNDPFSKIRTRCVEIALGKQDFSSIPKFFKDWGSKWNYFLAYVDLLADVCMDRNNESI